MRSAIVLDGELKSALTIVRSLGERGILLSVGATRTTGMALHSRYVTLPFTYPSPYTDEEGFVKAVLDAARTRGDRPVIFACSEVTHLALYRARERFADCATLVFPDDRAMEIAFDKAVTYSLARAGGVKTITTYFPSNENELRRIAETITYPAVVKPRKSVTVGNGVAHFESAHFVHDRTELEETFTHQRELLGEAPLIQERMIGEEYGVEAIVHEGKPFVLVTHHRMRSLKPTGGASVLKETCEKGSLRDTLEDIAKRLIEELAWEGPIMVEFKIDSDTREPYLMEINGRFWGSLPLSVAAGVDMSYHFYHLATEGEFPTDVPEVRSGVATRHFFGDVYHLLRVLFAHDPMRRFAYPKRWAAIKDFFKLPPHTRGDVWSHHDPKPAITEFVDIWKRRTK